MVYKALIQLSAKKLQVGIFLATFAQFFRWLNSQPISEGNAL